MTPAEQLAARLTTVMSGGLASAESQHASRPDRHGDDYGPRKVSAASPGALAFLIV